MSYKEELPPKLYPEETDKDRLYRRDIVPLIEAVTYITKIYLELRIRGVLQNQEFATGR